MSGDDGAIYLDYAATTPVDPAVASVMATCLAQHWANPSSAHAAGRRAARIVEQARARIAARLGCEADEIIFTSGATEAVNTAIVGAARFHAAAGRGRHVVTSRIDHRATLGPCGMLEREGFAVTRLEPDRQGLIEPSNVADALRPDTVLVAVTHANSELGTLVDVEPIASLCGSRGIALHVDAAQSAGKLPLDLSRLTGISFLSLSAHKCYGPKGVGALFVRRRPQRALLAPLVNGGGQEGGMRAGTVATHQVAGFAEALDIACADMDGEQARLAALRERLWSRLSALGGIHLNGHPQQRLAGHLNVSVEGVDGESLMFALSDLALSQGSACSSLQGEPSYVLRALGRDDRLAAASLRITLGRPTTSGEVDTAGARIVAAVRRLRALAPPSR